MKVACCFMQTESFYDFIVKQIAGQGTKFDYSELLSLYSKKKPPPPFSSNFSFIFQINLQEPEVAQFIKHMWTNCFNNVSFNVFVDELHILLYDICEKLKYYSIYNILHDNVREEQ